MTTFSTVASPSRGTYHGRPIIGLARDGLPVVEQTAEEQKRSMSMMLSYASSHGMDVENLQFMQGNMAVTSGPLDPITHWERVTVMQLLPKSGPSGLWMINEEPHKSPPAVPGGFLANSTDKSADFTKQAYAAFMSRSGVAYAAIDERGNLVIDGSTEYLRQALDGVTDPEQRTKILEQLFERSAIRYGDDAAPAPTLAELFMLS